MEYSFGATLPTFASCADRYNLSGYGGGGETFEEMMELASHVNGLDGVELVGNWHINDGNVKKVKEVADNYNLKICMVTVDLWTQAKWGKGSLTSRNASIRSNAVDEIKKSMDWAQYVNCPYIDVWLGQDGYDYYLQADYVQAWDWILEGISEAADYNDNIKLLIEYKMKEPRSHCFISTVGKTILLIDEIGKENVKVLLDIGHASSGCENPAESIALLNGRSKKYLEYIHFNDNYHSWDDDMLVGSVHLPELLETIYWIKKTKYSGWLTLDIFPYREDGVESAKESITWIKEVMQRIDEIGVEVIDKIIAEGDGVRSTNFLRKFFLGRV